MKPILPAVVLALLAGPALAQDAQPGIVTDSPAQTSNGDASPAPADSSTTAPAKDPASADTATGASSILVPIGKDDAPVPSLNLMVDQVEELDVVGADGSDLGEVSNVLGDQTGQPKAVTVEVGGFLGVGQKTVILMLQDVTLDLGKLRTTLTKEQIEKMPDFNG
ncbi:PRC-barrel domain-containing protein [Aurantimonas sp. VKM B-3413]|uniref:PRC-barrel domain-containing protein n=1 Tax=Aurantimonas sp. VKM B-3413 TaxID=2779401 RepID=UPI001E2CDB7F|nr:PRC-barrel domain-containing protein [Aurantimonas sp. VKM B-3413]MCB8838640.1 PRC-barrel domain-containing protein [Aurantimonas sp. VKM B-3413]